MSTKPNKVKPVVNDSINQTLKIPKVLYQRALSYYKTTGINITSQLRSSLNDFLTKNNY